MVSLAVGATAGIGLWILGVTGVFPAGSTYALVFAALAAVVEIIPYVGPWLGALAPAAVAATQSGTAVIAVALLFLFIHQIEGHIIVPKLMGGAVKVHPLVVIFALLAAGELYGLAGVLLAMPLVAIGREVAAFLLERIGLEPWRGGADPGRGRDRGRPTPASRRRPCPPPASSPYSGAVGPVVVGRGQVGRMLERLHRRLGAARPGAGTCRTSGRPGRARSASRSGAAARRSPPCRPSRRGRARPVSS